MAHEPGVHEIELRCLGEALPDVGPERVQQADDVRSLENGKPRLYRFMVGVNSVTDIRSVEKLPRPGGAGDHETVELRLVLDVDEIAHVSFQVGGDIV